MSLTVRNLTKAKDACGKESGCVNYTEKLLVPITVLSLRKGKYVKILTVMVLMQVD